MPSTQMVDQSTQMSSRMIRDLMPEQLPEIVMPECKVRPVLKGQPALILSRRRALPTSPAASWS